MITGFPVTISYDGMKPMRFDSISKASTSTWIPYVTLLSAKKNFRKGGPAGPRGCYVSPLSSL